MIPRISRLLAFSVLPGILLVVGCRQGATPAGEEEAAPAPVKIKTAEEVPLTEWTELVGTTQALPGHSARVSAVIEGRVVRLLGEGDKAIAEGQVIEEGQIIAQLDDRIAKANRDKVAAGQEKLKELKNQAEVAVELARLDVTRLEKLLPVGTSDEPGKPLVARIELDRARLTLKDAESKQKGAVADLEAAKAELRALDEQLNLYTIRAPIRGRLGHVQVNIGQTLAVGTVIADVVDLDEVDVLCYVPPRTVSLLSMEQPARIASDDDDSDEPTEPGVFPGRVVFLGVTAFPDTGNFPVKVRFKNEDLEYKIGAIQHVLVQTKPEVKRLVVPDAAIMEDQDPPAVVVVEQIEVKEKEGKKEKFGKARILSATLGVRDRAKHVTEILALQEPKSKDKDEDEKAPKEKDDPNKMEKISIEGAVFVVEGLHGLRNGDVVKIEEEPKKEEPK
jgi:RND family efflux transporter MFP subunit